LHHISCAAVGSTLDWKFRLQQWTQEMAAVHSVGKVDHPLFGLRFLSKHLFLSGMWFGVNQQRTRKDMLKDGLLYMIIV
jgi:hypothetical protein